MGLMSDNRINFQNLVKVSMITKEETFSGRRTVLTPDLVTISRLKGMILERNEHAHEVV